MLSRRCRRLRWTAQSLEKNIDEMRIDEKRLDEIRLEENRIDKINDTYKDTDIVLDNDNELF